MLKKWQSSQVMAHVVPFFLFLAILPLVGIFKNEHSALPWWQQHPEHWLYPTQILICSIALFFWRKHYNFHKFKAWRWGILFGIIGIFIWLIPNYFQKIGTDISWLQKIGFVNRTDGFNPYIRENSFVFTLTTLALRLIRMVIIVSLVEEIFWRSFLMRYLIHFEDDFKKIKFGTHNLKAYFICTIAFMLAHSTSDWLGAFLYGTLAYFLTIKFKSLGAVVVMHATANFLLAVYILKTKQFGLW